MKRAQVVAAAVFLGSSIVQKEIDEAECKEHACANELTARVPDQPHTLEEPPEFYVPEGMVEIPSSPPVYPPTIVPIGSEEHLRAIGHYNTKPGTPITILYDSRNRS